MKISTDEIINYGWHVYQNPKTRFYPILDGVEDLRHIIEQAQQDKSLVVLKKDNDLAVFPLFVDHEEKYVQAICGIVSGDNTVALYEEFYGIICLKFPEYKFSIGYPSSNTSAISFLNERGFRCEESLIRYELELSENNNFLTNQDICELQNEDNIEFCSFHNKNNPAAYWTGEKIIESRDRWTIIIDKDTTITGTACARHYSKKGVSYAEIYFLTHTKSLESLLQSLQSKGVQRVVYLIEETEDSTILEELGFKIIDDYLGYVTQL